MQIRECDGELVNKEGECLANYVPVIVAVARKFGGMAGVVVNHAPNYCTDAVA